VKPICGRLITCCRVKHTKFTKQILNNQGIGLIFDVVNLCHERSRGSKNILLTGVGGPKNKAAPTVGALSYRITINIVENKPLSIQL
jgi:hypothetical protein